MKSFIVAISGASGVRYGIRLIEELLGARHKVYLCISKQAFHIIKEETKLDWSGTSESDIEKKIQKHFSSKKIMFFIESNLAAPISSGSFITDGMFVVPCSMKTLAGIAHGYANNLIERAADVTLKENRTLVLSPREMPFNSLHLENMLTLSRLGVAIAPPIPAYYQKPEDIDDLINFVVGKILDSAGIRNVLFHRWG